MKKWGIEYDEYTKSGNVTRFWRILKKIWRLKVDGKRLYRNGFETINEIQVKIREVTKQQNLQGSNIDLKIGEDSFYTKSNCMRNQ